ncbi:exodeoxyribonuclease VII large subunit [Moraxellaceae bacterium AER2_44_116]|nr:exodeoxyribonuclease VII large subunit [Moraxellaceae bacterium AER2_44_116]
MNIDPNSITLSDYLNSVQQVIKTHCADAVWVRAEITNCSSKGGHYYLELAEKDPDTHQRVAATKATIWQFVARRIITKFEKETGIKFGKDLNVLVKLKASFSAEYGFSLNIDDIDSNFTVGDIAKKYLEIRNRLISEGLIDLNRALPTPFDFERVLVIAPENAAGLGDFKKDADALEQAGVCHFVYHYCLFQSTQAPIAIQETLKTALKAWSESKASPPDAIVIIRGGGAVNDLAYLNDFDLAALLCKRKVPIWVGIGHERDKTILDEVAHRSFDTPSKVIAGIRNIIVQNIQEAKELYQQIESLAQNQIMYYRSESDKLELHIRNRALTHLTEVKRDVDSLFGNNQYFAFQSIKQAKQQIDQYLKETLIQSPRNTLQRGYAIVRVEGRAINSIHQITNAQVSIELKDGIAEATIQQINKATP